MSEYFGIQEAADYLDVDYKVVYRLVKEGRIPSHRVGWQFRITEDDLNAYTNAERVKQEAIAEGIRQQTLNKRPRGRPRKNPLPETNGDANGTLSDAAKSEAIANAQAAAQAAVQAEAASGVIPKLKARQMEQNFINRFNEKIAIIDVIRHPVSGEMINIDSWSDRHQLIEDREALMQAMKTAFLDKRTLATTPRNAASRYTVSGSPDLVIEAKMLANLEAFCQHGQDEAPATIEDLMVAIDEYEEILTDMQAIIVVGFASPTGWADDAIKHIAGGKKGNMYRNANLKVLLVDLRSEAVYHDGNDETTSGFSGLFLLPTDNEQMASLREMLRAEADEHSGIILSDFSSDHNVSDQVALDAAELLVAGGRHRLLPDKKEGWILVKV